MCGVKQKPVVYNKYVILFNTPQCGVLFNNKETEWKNMSGNLSLNKGF